MFCDITFWWIWIKQKKSLPLSNIIKTFRVADLKTKTFPKKPLFSLSLRAHGIKQFKVLIIFLSDLTAFLRLSDRTQDSPRKEKKCIFKHTLGKGIEIASQTWFGWKRRRKSKSSGNFSTFLFKIMSDIEAWGTHTLDNYKLKRTRMFGRAGWLGNFYRQFGQPTLVTRLGDEKSANINDWG